MRKYELFEMGDREIVMDMYTRFTHITNELKSLGKTFTTEELVKKILRFLPRTWEAKFAAIQEAKDLEVNIGHKLSQIKLWPKSRPNGRSRLKLDLG